MRKDSFAIFKVKVTAKGLYDKNMTVSTTYSELRFLLLQNSFYSSLS